jgi:D-alanine-D-alanine ligase
MARLKIAVVMGGPSSEREVSIVSGKGVLHALALLGHDGQSLDFDHRFVDAVREIAPDLVFNALHGSAGEDGQIQGILEWLGIPYTGSDITA